MQQKQTLALHPAIRAYFQRRNVVDEQELSAYLYPTLAELPEPSLLQSMRQAVTLVAKALTEQRDILIWGDYDVDGITATALLVRFFRTLGAPVHFHIPDRLTEGYGLHAERLTAFAREMKDQKLLITVDCGISNHREVSIAKQLGFEVIVTDHHNFAGVVPDADAVVNPKRLDCGFPGKELAGVGVAFYLAAGIRSELHKNGYADTSHINLKSFLDLVSVGTIADVMPLIGVNRILTKAGFEVLTHVKRRGLSFLLHELGMNVRLITGEQISFQVAPVINAAGRLGRPEVALQMLLSEDENELKRLSGQLIELNMKRRELAQRDLEIALTKINIPLIEHDKCIIISGPFHEGILGITAARLVELFHVPALVCSDCISVEGRSKGSARAPIGFNLYEAIGRCASQLISFGGHAAAAGFSLTKEMLPAFRRAFIEVARDTKAIQAEHDASHERTVPLAIDEALDTRLLKNLEQLEPTGEGNPRPLFFDSTVKLISLNRFGKDKEHFRATIRGRYQNVVVVGFGLGEKAESINHDAHCSLVYTHMADSYNGRTSWKLRAEDIWQ